jgi:hypothetical protein
VSGAHPGLDGSEWMFRGLASDAHVFRRAVVVPAWRRGRLHARCAALLLSAPAAKTTPFLPPSSNAAGARQAASSED